MSKKKNVSVIDLIKHPLGQGFVAFVVGGIGFIIGQMLMSYIGLVIFNAFMGPNGEGFRTLAESRGAWLWIPTVTVLVISSAISAALGASAVVLVMRGLGIKFKWHAAVISIILACIMYVIINLIFFATGTNSWHSVLVQTISTYISILAFGLPFSIAWLWATRTK